VFVLGIDPGLSRCGYGAVDRDGNALRARACGVIRTPPDLPVGERLLALETELGALVAELRPTAIAIEQVFFQTNVRSAMAVGQASGIALLVAARGAIPVVQYTPSEVKMAVTGFGGADKRQMQSMVQVLLRLPAPPDPPDVADALALALCHHAAGPLRTRTDAAPGGRRPSARLQAAIDRALAPGGRR